MTNRLLTNSMLVSRAFLYINISSRLRRNARATQQRGEDLRDFFEVIWKSSDIGSMLMSTDVLRCRPSVPSFVAIRKMDVKVALYSHHVSDEREVSLYSLHV